MQTDLPYVGLTVSYYPNNQTRLAAIVTEVHPVDEGLLPSVNLFILDPKCKDNMFGIKIQPVQDEGEALQELEDRWSFSHQYLVHPEDEALEDGTDSNVKGTQSNAHVGILYQEGC